MRLKKLEIQGFKSFADKTEIQFLDGITTIVGPNGSGKSNISDAIRWVIGEQSAKNLRGSKMEDVIFAGTQARKKVGFAEVSMYLDNVDSTLPIEYQEVIVTRRVYRNGESNYLINGTECRLKDIQSIFMDTGLGKDGYSIISQGKIDEILSSKSEERRHIFEEASGIVKYRTRKDEANRKLQNTDITLQRVTDVINEIENIIGPLEQKSEVAKKYLSLRDSLKILDVKIFINSIETNESSLNELDNLIKTFEEDVKSQDKLISENDTKKQLLKEKVQELSLRIEELREKYYEIDTEKERLNSRISLLNSNVETGEENQERLKNEINEDNEKIVLLENELETRTQKREAISSNKEKFEVELVEKEKLLKDTIGTLDDKELEIEDTKKVIDENNERKYDIKSRNSSIEATIEANEKQLSERAGIREKSIMQKDKLNFSLSDVQTLMNSKNKELTELNRSVEDIQVSLKEKQDEIQVLEENRGKVNQELITFRAKHNYLLNLENENEGYSKSVKSILDYAKNNSKVHGTIANLIKTEEKYEYAIEIALGGYVQNIIVENEIMAKNLITYLNNNSLGRVTFLPLDTIINVQGINPKMIKGDGVIGIASDLVKYDSYYDKAIRLALANTVVVDTIDNAVILSKKSKNSLRIVTLNGELVTPTGSITGGKNANRSSGVLGRKEKINNLKETIVEKEAEFEKIKVQMTKLEEEKNTIQNRLDSINPKKEEFVIEIATLTEKSENIQKEIAKIEQQKEEEKEFLEGLKINTEKLKEEIIQNEKEINTIESENSQKQMVIDEYSRFNKEKQKELDILNEDVVNLRISLSSFDETVASIDEMKEKINQDILNFKQGIDKKQIQIVSINDEKTIFLSEIENINDKIQNSSKSKEEYLTRNDKLKEEKASYEANIEELDTGIITTMNTLNSIKEEKAKVENKRIKFEIELANLKTKMWDDYELTISSSKALINEDEEIDIKYIQKEANNFRKQIKDLGEVNISSIEEYQKTKERYDFITNQKNDLEETKEKLEKLITDMLNIMKQQFSKNFKIITENFNKTFKELFGGGKAELKLSDENDVLNSGIEVEVQPPGKKLQNMMLLSGGERALTATALLFAILELKSPPFCILDEIEAALDDINVHRFAEYIKDYSKKNQFIVITHRKGTMEVGSSIYGITMQEYGISKVVSMKLKQ